MENGWLATQQKSPFVLKASSWPGCRADQRTAVSECGCINSLILSPPLHITRKKQHFQTDLSDGGKGTPGQEEEQEAKAQEAEKSTERGRQHSCWKGSEEGARRLNYKTRGSKLIL